jgi:protein disulfide-isomerase A6
MTTQSRFKANTDFLLLAWDKLATAFKNEPNVVIAKVDADNHKDLGSRFDVSGFPTLKFFPSFDKSTPEAYSGGRDLESLVGFVNEKALTNRKVDGRLDSNHGVLADLSETVTKFLQNADSRAETLAEAEKVLIQSYFPQNIL